MIDRSALHTVVSSIKTTNIARQINSTLTDYQNLSSQYTDEVILRTQQSILRQRPHYTVVQQKTNYNDALQLTKDSLISFKRFYSISPISQAHFQLQYTVKAISEHLALYTTQNSVNLVNMAKLQTAPFCQCAKSKSVDYDHEHQLFVSNNRDDLYIYSFAAQSRVSMRSIQQQGDEWIGRVLFSCDSNFNKQILIVGNLLKVYFCSPETFAITSKFNTQGYANDLSVGPKHGLYALAEDHVDLELFDDKQEDKPVITLKGHLDYNYAIKFMDERLLASAGQDHSIRIWDLRSPKAQLHLIQTKNFHCYSLEYSRKNNILFALEQYNNLLSFKLDEAQYLIDDIGCVGVLSGMSLTPSENKLMVGCTQFGSGLIELNVNKA